MSFRVFDVRAGHVIAGEDFALAFETALQLFLINLQSPRRFGSHSLRRKWFCQGRGIHAAIWVIADLFQVDQSVNLTFVVIAPPRRLKAWIRLSIVSARAVELVITIAQVCGLPCCSLHPSRRRIFVHHSL
jgi:hypothetical protein